MTSQESLPGMPERLISMSPAKLDSWLDCPRKYRWQYLDRPKVVVERFARTMMGVWAHGALRSWWADDTISTIEAVEAQIASSWDSSLFRDDAQSQRAQARVKEWVRNYLNKVDPHVEVLGVERNLGTTTEHLTLSGRIDRIDKRAEEVVVVDYKTGRRPLTDDDARVSFALAIYADSVRRSLRKPCLTVELHHLPTATVLAHTHTPESLARHLGRVDAIGVEIRDAQRAVDAGADVEHHFPAQPGPLCGWCDFWSFCSVGQATTARRERWDGVDEVDSSSEPDLPV